MIKTMTSKQRIELVKRIITIFEKLKSKYSEDNVLVRRLDCAIREGNRALTDETKFITLDGKNAAGDYTAPLLYKNIDKKTYNLMCKYNKSFGIMMGYTISMGKSIFYTYDKHMIIASTGVLAYTDHAYSGDQLTYEEFIEFTSKFTYNGV